MSKRLNPIGIWPAWPEEAAVDRLHQCKSALYIHGFITETENKRIQERMLKWVECHVTKAKERNSHAN